MIMKQFPASHAGHQATASLVLREMKSVLLVLGLGLTLAQSALGAPFTFGPTGSMISARYDQTTTLLPGMLHTE